MRRIGYCLLIVLLIFASHAAAEPPAALRRGINITNWLRYPASRDPAALRDYLDDAAIDQLKRAGFTFVRLPLQSDMLSLPDALTDAIARLQRHGLAVVVPLFPVGWNPEAEPAKLLAAWWSLAPMLRRFNPSLTFPEVLNEPVFANDPAAWTVLQHEALAAIRAVLPANTVVLTGTDWGSVRGLLALTPETDTNVVYSFHFYDPAELTALGAYRQGLDSTAMARLPFPAEDQSACAATVRTTGDAQTVGLMRFYCALGWDAAKLATRIAQAGDWARRNHVNVIAGEFGASDKLASESRLTWLAAVRIACEQQGIGWALWGYDDSMGFGVRPPTGPDRLDPGIMRALGLGDLNHGK
jgi:endoglucanase